VDHPLLVAVGRHAAAEAGAVACAQTSPIWNAAPLADSAPVLEDCFRRVHDHVGRRVGRAGAPLFHAGAKSLGGRIAR